MIDIDTAAEQTLDIAVDATNLHRELADFQRSQTVLLPCMVERWAARADNLAREVKTLQAHLKGTP